MSPEPKPPLESPVPEKKGRVREFIDENVPTLVAAIALALGVRWLIAEPRYIPSSSMEPTLQINDRLIVEKITYRFRLPERGEVVVFYPPTHPLVEDTSKVYIKRVVGLPGDRLRIATGQVFVNDLPLEEPYTAEGPRYQLPIVREKDCLGCFQPPVELSANGTAVFVVPPGHYWVMGDNRNNSQDSHAWGFLPQQNLVGRAVFRYWPLDRRFGLLPLPPYAAAQKP
ncbi:MAG: signal peptidase I [Oscillatoriales cyanobacterium SM2_1_8]|nr:signal peptidase I [Oscillatoriales cyanobacterium SM2_1_8]